MGPEQAPALSRAVVDAGLKLLSLEMSEQERSGLAASAVAATVEETVNRVASLPDHILDNQELLEGFALEAFEQAAAANLPAVLSEATYRQRPELLEAGVNAAWILMPLRGRKRYKRCTRPFKVSITPHMAEEVESFDGVPLSDYLQDQLGLPEGEDVEAEMYLYEALPGTTIADIARSEAETPGLGASDEATLSQFHPLTRNAAAILLAKPGLGRVALLGSHRRNLAVGQRLFHLVIPGRRPLTIPGGYGRRRVRRLFHLIVTLDVPQDQIRVCVYLSEVKAQQLAVRLRQQSHAGSVGCRIQQIRRAQAAADTSRPSSQAASDRAPWYPAGTIPDVGSAKTAGNRAGGLHREDARVAGSWLFGVHQDAVPEIPRGQRGSGRRRHASIHDRKPTGVQGTQSGDGRKGTCRQHGRRNDRQGRTSRTFASKLFPGHRCD